MRDIQLDREIIRSAVDVPAAELGLPLGATDALHHVGFVVPSIAEVVHGFASSLSMTWDGLVFNDPVQTVKVTFLRHGQPASPSLELIEPASLQSRVSGFLKRGGGLHHLCYEVDSVPVRLNAALHKGAVLLLEPSPAVAFGGRDIAWVYTREKLLVEYLQRGRNVAVRSDL
jgi:methylmalonyl-CoA/ethylmalonyl-CoA epimerase